MSRSVQWSLAADASIPMFLESSIAGACEVIALLEYVILCSLGCVSLGVMINFTIFCHVGIIAMVVDS